MRRENHSEARKLSDGRICISIGARNLDDLEKKLKIARTFGRQLIELRLDYLKKVNSGVVHGVRRLLKGNEILTFRSHDEGGFSRLSEDLRRTLLREIISEVEPDYVDIEVATLQSDPAILDLMNSSRSKLIASSHNFLKTETRAQLANLILGFMRNTNRRLYAVKVVRPAKRFEDNLRILSLYALLEKIRPVRLVAFCAGEMGIFSRLSCLDCGSPFTYVSLPNERTAPGQLDIETIRVLLAYWK